MTEPDVEQREGRAQYHGPHAPDPLAAGRIVWARPAPDRHRGPPGSSPVDLAAILGAHGIPKEWCPDQRKAARAITICRTVEAGGHVLSCAECGYQEIAYNSCRNRHCPTCQGAAQHDWLEKQEAALLPVVYHHTVFTVPDELKVVFLSAPRQAYDLLFEAVSETLKEVAATHLGGQIGFTAVLHTWTQKLDYHPHIHCIVPGGALQPGDRWQPTRERYFLPVEILSKVFRGKLLSKLQAAIEAGTIPADAPGGLGPLQAASRHDWVVWSTTPAAGAARVLAYLSRYTYRVAISNRRLVALDGDLVSFRYKDRRHGNQERIMTLSLAEFVRRFIGHVLPTGFVRIRHFGFLAGSVRKTATEKVRKAIGDSPPAPIIPDESWDAATPSEGGQRFHVCPACASPLAVIERLSPERLRWLLQGSATAS